MPKNDIRSQIMQPVLPTQEIINQKCEKSIVDSRRFAIPIISALQNENKCRRARCGWENNHDVIKNKLLMNTRLLAEWIDARKLII